MVRPGRRLFLMLVTHRWWVYDFIIPNDECTGSPTSSRIITLVILFYTYTDIHIYVDVCRHICSASFVVCMWRYWSARAPVRISRKMSYDQFWIFQTCLPRTNKTRIWAIQVCALSAYLSWTLIKIRPHINENFEREVLVNFDDKLKF